MKKILLFASALAGLFLAASCQRENLEPVGGNTVTYTVQVPGALSTKAIGTDVSKVTELIYEVYRIDENDVETRLYQKTTSLTDGSATVELELVNNQDFRVLFWAQVPENGVYTTTSLKNVTLATGLNANAENYAAFAGQDEITSDENLAGRTVTLVRPVAQLNIATSAESLVIGEGGIDPTTVTFKETAVTVEGLSTVYNVAEGAAGADEATFTYAAKPVVLSETTLEVNGVDYSYVAMNYVGFAQPSGDNVKVTYTIETNEVGTITNTISNVPVKANHRTNIIGNLITSTSDYTVTLDAAWPAEEENVEVISVSTAADLQEAINAIPGGVEGNITLTDDIDLSALASMISTKADAPTYGLLIPADKAVVLDLNGYKLSQETQSPGYSMIQNNGTLTLIGEGLIVYKYTGNPDSSYGKGNSAISNFGILNVDGSTVENATGEMSHASFAIDNREGATLNVKQDGTVKCLTAMAVRMGQFGASANEVNVTGGHIIGERAVQMHLPSASATTNPVMKLNVTGGTLETNENTYNIGVYVLSSGQSAENVNVKIGGDAEIKGSVLINAAATNTMSESSVEITGGFISGTYGVYSYSDDTEKAKSVINITGGTFAVDPSEYVADGYGVVTNENGTFTVEKLPTVAKIGDTEYLSLGEAVKYVKESETITILEGTIEEGTIKLPASLKNVTFKGEEGAILKDMTIIAADGNSISYEGLTFEGLTFENSRISITGWRTNGAVVKNFTVTNCTFRSLDDTTNSAPVHINMDADEAVNGFTFTNNVIDGATGGSKSGIYAQVTGEVLVSGNIINNVAFRPYVIQVTTDDNIADIFVVTNNTFSGSAAGRAQGLGNNAEGTDAVNIVVTENIFKDITDAQQICYWNFNDATTEFDLSGNYYDIDILANPSRIYYNGAASGLADLIAKNIFPIYTELNADGTINKDSAYSPVPVAKVGDTEYYSLQEAVDVAETGATIIFLKDIEQVDGVLITDKNLTVDLNEKTFTVSEGANTNNRNFKIDGSSVVTIKNGIMVAAGDYSSGAYGTVRTEGTANVTLTDVKLYNYRGNGLNVKALSGTTVTISNTEVYSEYGGGIEAAGGTVELTDVTVKQKGMYTAPYNSMTISVNGGGTVTVNSGTYSTECLTAEEANNQGTSHGPWCAGVLNSGGKLIIKGGTFSNDNFGENSLATYARGLLLADTGAKIEISGGTFNALKNVIDIQNNLGDASKNPTAILNGGNYSSNPLTWDGLISVVEGKGVVEGEDGRWTLVKVQQNNEIWYTGDEKLEPTTPNAFNANIVSNVWDSTTGKGVITFDAPLTTIGNEAFKRITNETPSNWMTSISLPNSLETIGDYAFAQCFSLTSITIPDSVTSIGQYAFQSCQAATTVTIGSSVTSIPSGAFYGCWELKQIICKSTIPPAIADRYVFYDIDDNPTVIVPAGSVDAYKAANFWKDLNIVTE